MTLSRTGRTKRLSGFFRFNCSFEDKVDMTDFYRVTFWRTLDGPIRVMCSEPDATVAIVDMASSRYGFQSTPYEREFPMPGGKSDMKRHVRELERAYEIGRQAKASEVARTIRALCGD